MGLPLLPLLLALFLSLLILRLPTVPMVVPIVVSMVLLVAPKTSWYAALHRISQSGRCLKQEKVRSPYSTDNYS